MQGFRGFFIRGDGGGEGGPGGGGNEYFLGGKTLGTNLHLDF